MDEMEIIPEGSRKFIDTFVTFVKNNSCIDDVADNEFQQYLIEHYSKKHFSGRFGILLTGEGILIKSPGSNHHEDVEKLHILSEKILCKLNLL